MKKGWSLILWWVMTVALLLIMIFITYKTFGLLGAFIFAVVVLAIIVLAEELIFQSQGLFLKIARKIITSLKPKKPR